MMIHVAVFVGGMVVGAALMALGLGLREMFLPPRRS